VWQEELWDVKTLKKEVKEEVTTDEHGIVVGW
jgi:hypothetical protein